MTTKIAERLCIVITGPTATGKSALGALAAKALGGEVISADSMQVYKYMDIGTAKPTFEEMLGVPHHMLSILSPLEDYSVSQYVNDASRCVDDVLRRGKLPVIVGGSGLYIDSLISGREFSQRGQDDLRKRLEERYDESGGEAMLRELGEIDPERAGKLHANDRKRIVRALEIHEVSGKTISQHDRETQALSAGYAIAKIALTFSDRKVLYSRIDSRVGAMFDSGLVNEVQNLIDMGAAPGCTAMQAIGYKEISGALRGAHSMEAAAEMIKLRSRRYAKRQLTWLRRDDGVVWIHWDMEPDYLMGMSYITELLGNGELYAKE